MGKIVITQFDQVEAGAFPALSGLSAHGPVRSKGVIAGPDRGLFLWIHELAPGSEIRFENPPVDHVAFVWSGAAEFDGRAVSANGAVVVEHKGGGVLRAGGHGATIAHFHANPDRSGAPRKAGGHAHVMGPDGIFKGGTATVLADSTCPTCDAWLHHSTESEPRPQDNRHRHTEDEIIVVKGGGMLLGKRIMREGTAIAIDVDTIYSFGVPPEGLEQITFRATDPHIIRLNAKNEPLNAEPIAMRDLMRKSPVGTRVAQR